MNPARLFSLLVISTLLIYSVAGFYCLPLASYEGDLTRMGKLPESLFGWTNPQPAVKPELLHQADWHDADVLVIGDSFSKPHLWQTALTAHGLKVHTEDWADVHAICDDFTNWAHAKGFKGQYVILENVERGAEGNLDKSLRCHAMQYRKHSKYSPAPPPSLPDRHHDDYSGKLSVGLATQLHIWEYNFLSSAPDFSEWHLPNQVIMRRITNGCDLFSHPRCQDVLFFGEDHIADFDQSMLDKMSQIEARLPGVTTIWAIVPDKTTAYLNANKQFWNKASQRFRTPDLLSTFHQAIEHKSVDLYRGNDTHLSTRGFLIMGETIRLSLPQP